MKKILLTTLIFLSLWGLYLKIAAPAIAPGDAPEFTTAAYTLGIPHPPGYPFWSLSAHLFTTLPLGNIGWRANLVSCASVALAAALLFLAALRFLSATAGFLSVLFFATAFPILLTAGGAEAYPQLILLIALLFFLSSAPEKPAKLMLLLLGLGLGVHYLSLLFWPAWWLLTNELKLPRPTFNWLKKAILVVFPLLLGLAIFLALPIRAAKGPYLSWGRVENRLHFQLHVQRAVYQEMERGQRVDWNSRKDFALAFLKNLAFNVYAWGGALLFLWGLLMALYRRQGRLLQATLTIFFLPVILIILSLRFRFNELNLSRLQNYYLPVYLIGALLIGYAYQSLPGKNKYWRGAIWSALVCLALFSLYQRYPQIEQRRQYQTYDLGENLVRQLPRYTIFFTKSDPVTFPLWFLQAVNDQRLDISVVTTSFMQPSQFYWYRYHLRDFYPWMFVNPSEAELADKIQGINPWVNQIIVKFSEKQPVYYELNENLLISIRYVALDGMTYRVRLEENTAPDLPRTALILDRYTTQRGLKNLPDYVSGKIKETAFVYAITNYFLAEKLRKTEQFPQARYYINRSLDIYPRTPFIQASQGAIEEGLGNVEAAKNIYQDILTRFPANQAANVGLSRIFAAEGQKEKAGFYWQNFQRTLKPPQTQ